MNRIFSSRTVLTTVDERVGEDTPLLLFDTDVEGNNNEVGGTVTRRSVPLKKILIPLLAIGVIGSLAATIGVAAAPGSKDDWAPLLALEPEAAAKLKKIQELAPQRWRSESRAPDDVCYTVPCLDLALDILTSINTSVNPCDDFYEFACGRWRTEHPLDPSQGRTGRFNKLRDEVNSITQQILTSPVEDADFEPLKQTKQFYKQCVDLAALDAAGTAPVTNVLNSLGGWPSLAGDSWTTADLILTLGTIRRVFLESILLRVYVSQDLKNTTRSVIYLDQPGFFLSRNVLLDPVTYEARIAAYKTYYTDVIGELGGNTTNAAKDVEAVIALETALAEVASPDALRGNVSRIYNPKKLDAYQAELEALEITNPYAKINISALLEEIFKSSGVTIGQAEDIIVLEEDYYKNLLAILDKTELRTIVNYIHWRVASGLLPETTNRMREITFNFDKVNSGLSEPAKRETTCANAALNGFGIAVGTKYIEIVGFADSAVDNLNTLVENLRISFKELLDESEWMSDATKPNAKAKADAIKSFMAYPEWLDNKTVVESKFAGLTISDNYLASVTALSTWMGDESLKSLRKETDRDEWLTYPSVVNAFYSPELNSITFPAGILQPPFYRIGGLNSINYGGIGVVIGHEITHGFDDQGSQYGANGNAENWWSEADLAAFETKAQCIVDQYTAFEPLEGKHIDGDLTSGENIADNGGLREAYLAYRNWVAKDNGGQEERRLPGLEDWSPDQLFFLGYASLWCENSTPQYLENQLNTDPHSPGEYRVLGPLVNSETFAEKWQCPVGSRMNPDPTKRCVVW